MDAVTAPRMSIGQRLAPLGAAIAIGAVWMFGYRTDATPAGADQYFEAISETIEALPYKIEDWIGVDVPVQPAAAELLNPNKLMQRRYRNPFTGESVQVLVVHCGQTRDMLGHFPPVCYPAHGWVRLGESPVVVLEGANSIPAMEYQFRRSLRDSDSEMVVTNFFILPDDEIPTAPDIGALNRAAQSLALSALGAAQVQIVTEPRMGEKRRREIVDVFTRSLQPVIDTVSREKPLAR